MQLFTLLPLLAFAAAAPSVSSSSPETHPLAKRMDDHCEGHFSVKIKGISLYTSWHVNIAGAKYYTHGDNCGGGFLDNFRGRCGVITDWSCTYDENTADAKMSFKTSTFCSDYDITQAIHAASYGERETPCALDVSGTNPDSS